MKSKTSVAILCSAIAASVFGGTIYVSPAGGGDGSSAESPSTYYEVMKNLESGSTIKFLDGDYSAQTIKFDTSKNSGVSIADNVTLEGNVEHPENVTISGGGTFIYFKRPSEYVVKGMTFSISGADNGVLSLYLNAPTVTVQRCVFSNNTSKAYAVLLADGKKGKAVVEDCTVADWITDNGAISLGMTTAGDETEELTVRRCSFVRCNGLTSAPGVRRAKLVEDCTFVDCQAKQNGGALYRFPADAIVRRCVFSGCFTRDANTAGAIQVVNHAPKIEDCQFIGCHGSYGGAINSDGFALDIHDSLFVSNYCTGGGSVFRTKNASTPDVIENCTFVGNTGNGSGTTHAPFYMAKVPAVKNCIFWGNKDKVGGVSRVSSQSSGISTSAADIEFSGCTLLTASPFVDAENGDYTLAKNVSGVRNPCLESGEKLDWMTDGCLDLAGNPRIRAGATLPDLGCYEYTQVGGLYIYIR